MYAIVCTAASGTIERAGQSAQISSHLQVDSGIIVGVDRLAEVDGVTELLLQHWLAGVARELQQEETGVGLRHEVVRWLVLVQHLRGRGDV